MSGYKISIDNVRKLSHLNVDFEEIIREVMMSQGRRFCTYEEPKCEQEAEAQKTDTQQTKVTIEPGFCVHRDTCKAFKQGCRYGCELFLAQQ